MSSHNKVIDRSLEHDKSSDSVTQLLNHWRQLTSTEDRDEFVHTLMLALVVSNKRKKLSAEVPK